MQAGGEPQRAKGASVDQPVGSVRVDVRAVGAAGFIAGRVTREEPIARLYLDRSS